MSCKIITKLSKDQKIRISNESNKIIYKVNDHHILNEIN